MGNHEETINQSRLEHASHLERVAERVLTLAGMIGLVVVLFSVASGVELWGLIVPALLAIGCLSVTVGLGADQ